MDETRDAVGRRTFLSGAAALGLSAACTTAAMPWTPPAPHTFKVVEHHWVPMRDGVRLSARLWIPEGSERWPAVLETIPYRKRDRYRFIDDIWGATLAGAGIAFVRIDVRGSGDSEGALTDEYSERELDDCMEAIAWIAQQAWCTGAVGMRGLSWGGINTLAVAAKQPPALRAIMPMACTDNRFTDDAHYIGGALGRTNFQWGLLFKTVMAAPPDPAIVGDAWRRMWQQRLNATPAILAEWLRRQRDDRYWRRGSVATDYSRIRVPAYLVSGWDDTYAVPVLRLLDRLTSPARALIGPWGHTYPNLAQPLAIDWAAEEIRWWRHWLNGEATGIMDEPRLRCFMPSATTAEMGAAPIPGRWIAEPDWPRRYATRTFHLNDGALGAGPVRGVSIVHRDSGVVGTTKPEWLDRPPGEQSHDDKLSTTFDSGALAAPLEMLGAPRVRLSLACDKPVANVVLRLCEVRPDGTSWLVTWAVVNLNRHRSMAEPRPVGNAIDTRDIHLRPVAHHFSAGSRIRLSLSEGWWPMVWPSPETPTLRIASGVSTLDLPVRPTEAAPAPLPMKELAQPGAEPARIQPVAPDATRKVTLTHAIPVTPYRVEAADIELASGRSETCEIVAGNPLSSVWRQSAESTWRRGDWSCTVRASYELTCDASAFRLRESLEASTNGEAVITVSNETRIPRDHL